MTDDDRPVTDPAGTAPDPGLWRVLGRFALAALAGVGAATAGIPPAPFVDGEDPDTPA